MKMLLPVVLFALCLCEAYAGRRFSEELQMETVELFQTINPGIMWTPGHHLAALAGWHATCDDVYRHGSITVRRFHRDRSKTITGFGNFIQDTTTHVEGVSQLIGEKMKEWTQEPTFSQTIRDASEFGCSSQPGCGGQIILACLFS